MGLKHMMNDESVLCDGSLFVQYNFVCNLFDGYNSLRLQIILFRMVMLTYISPRPKIYNLFQKSLSIRLNIFDSVVI